MNEFLKVVGFTATYALPSGVFRVGADFEVGPGERVALFSPSGSGKTTLFRWMAGVAEGEASGKLFQGDREIGIEPPERRNLGIVFQDYALFPHLTALENVAFGLEMRGASPSSRKTRAREWLAQLDLGNRADVLAGLLSGGEKQRVALARALIWEPTAILMDEPFAALDLGHRKKARELVKNLLEKTRVPAAFITHDAEDVAALATRTLEYESDETGMAHFFGTPVR